MKIQYKNKKLIIQKIKRNPYLNNLQMIIKFYRKLNKNYPKLKIKKEYKNIN